MVIDSLFPCDIGGFVTIQEAIMRLRTIGLISTLVLGLLAAPLPVEAQQGGEDLSGRISRGYAFSGP